MISGNKIHIVSNKNKTVSLHMQALDLKILNKSVNFTVAQ